MGDISHTTGNVGIGTSSPVTKLHISGLGNSTTLTGTGALGGLHFTQNASNDSYVGFTTSATTTSSTTQGGILIQGSGAYGTKIHFLTTDAYVDGMKQRMTLDHLGNLGIGTASPTVKLDVVGDIKALSGITATGLTASGKASVKNIKITNSPAVYPALNSATSGFRYGISAGPYNATNYTANPAQAYNVSYTRIGRLVVVNGVVKTNSQLGAPNGIILRGLPKPNKYHLFHTGSPDVVPSSGALVGPAGDTYRFDIDETGTMLFQAGNTLAPNNWFLVHCKYFTAADEQ
jgi:hypothetical protein